MIGSVKSPSPSRARQEAVAILRSVPEASESGFLATRHRLLALARHSGDPRVLGDALLWRNRRLMDLRQFDEATSARAESRSIAERLNDSPLRAVCDVCEAHHLRVEGCYVEAVARIRQALPALAGHPDHLLHRQAALSTMCDIYTSLGMWEQAIETAAESDRLAKSRNDERAALRALYDELYSRLSRADAAYPDDSSMPVDDADLVRVESACRRYLRTSAAAKGPAHHVRRAFRQMLFQVLARSGRRADADAMWQQTDDAAEQIPEILDDAELAYYREGPARAVELLGSVVRIDGALTAENLSKAWRILSNAHGKLGDHPAALGALREHIRLELGQSQSNAKVQAALLGFELDAERNKVLAQRALVHTGKLAAVGQLASSVAHEVSQPVAALTLLAHEARGLLAAGRHEQLDEVVGDLETQVERLVRLVERMQDFARDEPIRLQRLNLRKIVEEAQRLCKPAIEVARVALENDVPDLLVAVDKERMILTVVNLVANALDAMRGQTNPLPRLRIEAARRSGAVAEIELSVIDTGPGLSNDVQARLFQPFFTTKDTGLGLGLTITREALHGMGAKIEGANEPGRGARFSVTFNRDEVA
jgi:signal transduction histidine kinase